MMDISSPVSVLAKGTASAPAPVTSIVQVPYLGPGISERLYRNVATGNGLYPQQANTLLYIQTADELAASDLTGRSDFIRTARAAGAAAHAVGVYGTDHRQALSQINMLNTEGVPVALVFPPRTEPGNEAPAPFYTNLLERVAKRGLDIGLLFYDNNITAPLGLSGTYLTQVLEHPNTAGIVGASRRGRNLLSVLEAKDTIQADKQLHVLGVEDSALISLILGADGAVFQRAALYPQYAADLVQRAEALRNAPETALLLTAEKGSLSAYILRSDAANAQTIAALYTGKPGRFISPGSVDVAKYLRDFAMAGRNSIDARRLTWTASMLLDAARQFAAVRLPRPGEAYTKDALELFALVTEKPVAVRELDDLQLEDRALARGNLLFAGMPKTDAAAYVLSVEGPETLMDRIDAAVDAGAGKVLDKITDVLGPWPARLADHKELKAWRAGRRTARLNQEADESAQQRGYKESPFGEIVTMPQAPATWSTRSRVVADALKTVPEF